MSQSIAARLVAALQMGPGVQSGERVNHARGLLVEGSFRASAAAAALFAAPMLDGSARPVLARFSSSGPHPRIPDDDIEAAPRGLALRIEGDQPLVLVGHSIEGFPAQDPREFLAFLEALNNADRDPLTFEAHLVRNPAAGNFGAQRLAPPPESLLALSYHMLHPYRIERRDGSSIVGRLTVASCWETISTTASSGPNQLEDDLRQQVARGAARLELVFSPAPHPSACDATDITLPWQQDGGAMVLGEFAFSRILPDQGVQRRLVFDISLLPAGLAYAGDPMIATRIEAYRLAADSRLRGAAPACPWHGNARSKPGHPHD